MGVIKSLFTRVTTKNKEVYVTKCVLFNDGKCHFEHVPDVTNVHETIDISMDPSQIDNISHVYYPELNKA